MIGTGQLVPAPARRNHNIKNYRTEFHKISANILKTDRKITGNNRILCQERHYRGAYTHGLFWAQRTGVRGCAICRGRPQGSQSSGGVLRSCLCVWYEFSAHSLCVVNSRACRVTHSSEMTTSRRRGDSSKPLLLTQLRRIHWL